MIPRRGGADGDAPVRMDYARAVDELMVTFADADNIEIFELVDDLELIFDAAEPGRLLGLVVRGLRLGRPEPWKLAVATVAGPTLWKAFQAHALEPPPVSEDEDAARACSEVVVPMEERARLSRGWLALHRSLHAAEWWNDRPARMWPEEPPDEPAEGPWVLAAPWPSTAATNVLLPAALAGACGMEPVGYARLRDGDLVVSFDRTRLSPQGRLVLRLAAPAATSAALAATGVVVREDELEVSFRPPQGATGQGLLVLVADMVPMPLDVVTDGEAGAQRSCPPV